jgi:fatty acid desaturase
MRCLRADVELPTLGLTLAVYALWAAAVVALGGGHRWAWPVLVLVLTLHSSLQHEHIHGHPTSSERLNALLAGWPLALWLPYAVYRRTHRAHHATDALTSPTSDPESFYVAPHRWRRLSAVRRALHWALQTLPGRLLLGPPVVIAATWWSELARWRSLPARRRRQQAPGVIAWALGVLAVMGVVVAAGVSLPAYVAGAVLPSIALTLLRSFAEHRPDADPRRRTVVVESSLLGWLYLHNNLHVVHHDRPGLAWYRLPELWRRERARYVVEGVPVLRGYRALLPTMFTPKDAPVHPGGAGRRW